MADWSTQLPAWVEGALSFFNWHKLHAVFGAIAAFISISTFGVRQWMKRRNAERSLSEAEKLVAAKQKKLNIIEKAANSHETHLWDLWPKEMPSWFREKWLKSNLRVLLLANFKGGVGKTTIAANLAVALARKGYKVLIIDFDYQGSLASRFQITSDNIETMVGASALLERDGRLFDQATMLKLSGIYKGISLVPAYYPLASLENRLMLQWLLQSEGDDLRFRLASKLLEDRVRNEFDVVIVDTPPRLTAGTINALCISTDVFIPTVVDNTSIDAVRGFAQTVRKFSQQYNSKLEIRGIIPSLTYQTDLRDYEKVMLSNLNKKLEEIGFGSRVLPFNIPRKAVGPVILGEKALYDADDNCKNVFDKIVESAHLGAPRAAYQNTRTDYENRGISVSA